MEEQNKKREYKPIDLRTMETLICIMVIVVHFFTIFFYAHDKVYVMVVSNIISISAYVILYLGLWRRNYDLSFIAHVYFISQAHSLFGCAYLGWRFNYYMYCISIIAISVFVFYMYNGTCKLIKIVAFVNIGILAILGVIRYLDIKYLDHPYEKNEKLVEQISTYNVFMCSMFIVIITLIMIQSMVYNNKVMEQQAKQLEYMTDYDDLTKLKSRRNLEQYIRNYMYEMRNGDKNELTLALGDIDDFKHVNDTYGHQCGDEVLVKIGEILNDNPAEVCNCGRWGGEEILIAFPMDYENSVEKLKELCGRVSAHTFEHDGAEFNVTMTFGIVKANTEMTYDELLGRADKLLYHGKTHGKNQVCTVDIVNKK